MWLLSFESNKGAALAVPEADRLELDGIGLEIIPYVAAPRVRAPVHPPPQNVGVNDPPSSAPWLNEDEDDASVVGAAAVAAA